MSILANGYSYPLIQIERTKKQIAEKTMKKIIYLISASSKDSEFEKQPRPEFSWEQKNGKMVGIWGLEWGDLIMKAVADYYEEYECEVWQPDTRAQKTYSAQLRKNLVHHNFPAVVRRKFSKFKFREKLCSEKYTDEIRHNDNQDTIFLVPVSIHRLWFRRAIMQVRKADLLYITLLNSELMLTGPVETRNPLKAIYRRYQNFIKDKWMKRVRNLLVQNDNPKAIVKIKAAYPLMNVHLFQMGLDLNFWKPLQLKQESRILLGIPADIFVIVLSQRLVPLYQIDRFIEVVSRLKTKREFICYITGHGSKEYEDYLHGLVEKHDLEDKIRFVGFVTDEELRSYFIAADIFATVPLKFAGSGGAQKCMALGTPILHVRSGCTYELLKENNAGVFVDPMNYDEWVEKLEEIINGKEVKAISRDVAENILSWGKTADAINRAINSMTSGAD